LSTWRTFEDIDSWTKSRDLCREIYSITKTGDFSHDFDLRSQIRKAAISAMSNIAEGFERSGTKEFIQFLAVAKGSVGEVMSQLYVAFDQNYITKSQFKQLYNLASETSKLIGGLMKYLKNSTIKGSKFKDDRRPQPSNNN